MRAPLYRAALFYTIMHVSSTYQAWKSSLPPCGQPFRNRLLVGDVGAASGALASTLGKHFFRRAAAGPRLWYVGVSPFRRATEIGMFARLRVAVSERYPWQLAGGPSRGTRLASGLE